MKITILFLTMSLLLAGFAMAAQQYDYGMDTGQIASAVSQAVQAGQGMMARLEAGNYLDSEGKGFSIDTETGDKLRLRVRNITADLGLNITSEQIQDRVKLMANLSNGRMAEIKVMPDTASETALRMLRLRVCNESNNCTIVLKEVGIGNQTRPTYEIQAERHAKILGIFQAKMQVNAEIDAETGEVVRVNKPWWSFIATQPEEG